MKDDRGGFSTSRKRKRLKKREKELTRQEYLDAIATSTAFIPGLGDIAEFGSLANREYEGIDKPAWWEWGMLAIPGGVGAAAGLIPKKVGSKHKTKTILNEHGKRVPRPKRMTEVPDLRGMDVDQAVKVAEYEPHLIPSSAAGEGVYVGGPRNIKNRRQLTNQRGAFDGIIERGAPGGDWYDRYRIAVDEVTGGNPKDDLWMTSQEGQYSANATPEGELGFALKDNNSALALGEPTVARMGAQKRASTKAIKNNDPSMMQLGDKTGEYARRVNPAASHERTATGVNDFRHARNLGYTEVSGEKQIGGLGSAAHRYMDYETALAVDRANQKGLAGRSDWTGEQIQAAPWVAQKGDDLFAQRTPHYMEQAKIAVSQGDNRPVEEIARELAFNDANKTIGDFYDKHTAFATYEAQPYVNAGHLPRLADVDYAEKARFAADPRSAWDFAPGGRDAIYSGMRLGDTGISMRTRPTQKMQGIYDPPGAPREYNPGYVARPLVAFDRLKDGTKNMPEADQALMDAAESTRAYIDVQGAGAWHKPWPQQGGTNKLNTSLMIAREPGVGSVDEMGRLAEIGRRHDMPDLVDTGQGYTMSKFYEGPPKDMKAKEFQGLLNEVSDVVGPGAEASRANVNSGYRPIWENDAGVGSGAVTKAYLAELDKLPEATVKAIDSNPYIPQAAAMRLERDADLAAKYGTNRQDVQKMREIIAEGPGFIGRLREAAEQGIVPAAAAAAVIRLSVEDDEEQI